MGRHRNTSRHLKAGALTRRYEQEHPGAIDVTRQVRSITAQVGRHRATAPRSMFVGDDEQATARIPRVVLTASAPLGGAA